MTIPAYHEFMLPLLRAVADGKPHRLKDLVPLLAEHFSLDANAREETLPSGKTKLYDRASWAYTYLVRAGLLDKVDRGVIVISERGKQTLRENPPKLDAEYLSRFPEFVAFIKKSSGAAATTDTAGTGGLNASGDTTPEERMEAAHLQLRAALASELRDRVYKLSPKRFEKLVVELLQRMGYGGDWKESAQVVGGPGDNGIDGTISEDRLGLDTVYIQAKRYSQDVGPGDIRQFAGSLGEHKANKGVFITSAGFTKGAREAANKATARIVLIDGEKLAQLMIDHGAGVSAEREYQIKRIDSDYFEDS